MHLPSVSISSRRDIPSTSGYPLPDPAPLDIGVTSPSAPIDGVLVDGTLAGKPDPVLSYSIRDAIPESRLSELSGACASAAASLIVSTQQLGKLVAYVHLGQSTFYPPDLQHAGIDLDSLLFVSVSKSIQTMQATEILLKSGAFSLIVVDLTGAQPPRHSSTWQGRLLALVRAHHSRVVFLTSKNANDCSLGSLISTHLFLFAHYTLSDACNRSRTEVRFSKDKLGIRSKFGNRSPRCERLRLLRSW